MKPLLITLLLSFVLEFSVSAQGYGVNTEIRLHREVPSKDDTGKTVPATRSIVIPTVYAYLYSHVVVINFEEILSDVTITIRNDSTHETVYSKTYKNSPTAVSIDLPSESHDTYYIDIVSSDMWLRGSFSLE